QRLRVLQPPRPGGGAGPRRPQPGPLLPDRDQVPDARLEVGRGADPLPQPQQAARLQQPEGSLPQPVGPLPRGAGRQPDGEKRLTGGDGEVEASARPWYRRLLPADGWLILLLVGLALKLTYHVDAVRDLGPSDEAAYMSSGFAIPHRGLPTAEECPLYCLWYYLLSFLQPTPLRLFYVSYSVLVALLSVGFYLLIRAGGGTRALAVLTTFL